MSEYDRTNNYKKGYAMQTLRRSAARRQRVPTYQTARRLNKEGRNVNGGSIILRNVGTYEPNYT